MRHQIRAGAAYSTQASLSATASMVLREGRAKPRTDAVLSLSIAVEPAKPPNRGHSSALARPSRNGRHPVQGLRPGQ
jgi:hypothetical protein